MLHVSNGRVRGKRRRGWDTYAKDVAQEGSPQIVIEQTYALPDLFSTARDPESHIASVLSMIKEMPPALRSPPDAPVFPRYALRGAQEHYEFPPGLGWRRGQRRV